MKAPLILTSTAFVLLGATQAQALSVSASSGPDAYGVQASQTILPTLRVGAGYFTSDDSGSDADIYSGSLMFSPYLPVIDLAVGGRYQYQGTGYGDGGALGLGGSLFVDTPIPLTSIGGYGFYAPEDLSHGDIEKSYEYGVQARINLVAQTYLHGGYHYYRTEFEDAGEQTLHSGPVIGVSVGF